MEDPVARFSEIIRRAAGERSPLLLRGGGSKDFYGRATEGELLDAREHAGIVAYDPSELVITARCGTPLDEVEAALDERGQMLAFEPPGFNARATFGGMIAAGLSGPRRAAAGAVRDYVLGARVMDGRGRELVFGGQVMKNVAGYDVSRLMAGSLGTLGLILDASMKTLPRPSVIATLRLDLPQDKALEALSRWTGRGLCVSASAWRGGELTLRLSGGFAAVSAAAKAIGGERTSDMEGHSFWRALRDQQHDFFREGPPLWRLSVPATVAPLALPGEQLLEWGGGLRWLRSEAHEDSIRAAAGRAGGHATLFRGGDRSGEVFHPLAPTVMKLHRELKGVFDPQGIFNPGRLYRGL